MPDQIAELEAAIAEARQQLDKADQAQKADLEAQIGQKTATLDQLKQQQTQQYENERAELEALRREKRERETRASLEQYADTIVAGAKARAEEEHERLARVMDEVLSKKLDAAGLGGGMTISTAIDRSLQQYRSGRKFVPDGDNGIQDWGPNDPAQGMVPGRKGGPAYVTAHKLGEKPTFTQFLCAVGRKDRSAVGDIQRAMGLQPGQKALVEGGGAVDATAGPSGGYLVPVEWGREIIALLYAQVVVRRAGARVQMMQSPVFRQPRLTGRSSASWVGETAPIAASQQTFDQFELNAKKLAALVPISNELLNDSDPAVGQIVTEDMARSIALLEDYTFLLGTGSTTTPAGILTLSGITTAAQGGVATYNMVVSMVFDLAVANVPEINRVWICHPAALRALMELTDNNDRPLFMDYMQVQQGTLQGRFPTLYGYPVLTTTQMTYTAGSPNTASLALVDAGYLIIGQVQELEIKTSDEASFVDNNSNTISAWQSDLTLFRAILRESIGVTHPAAISLRTGITV